MPLGLKVMVLPRVAPGHGACTVPGGGGNRWAQAWAQWAGTTAHRSPASSPGDVQENDALGFQVLDLGG